MTTGEIEVGLIGAAVAREHTDQATDAVLLGAPASRPRTLWDILETTAKIFPRALAIDDGRSELDYSQVLREVRRLSDRLASAGIGLGDRVGVRVESGTAELYLSILAVLAVGAAYVPVEMDDPDDRAELVWSEASVCAVIGTGGAVTRRIAAPTGSGARRPHPQDDAWIIFTSGTTGVPKGVAVTHRSAAAFVDAEANLFLRGDPLGPGDRVLAGLSVAFDASCEEMWLAWRHGACLVPAPRAVVKAGPELATWLVQHRISVVSTVPTLASMLPVEELRGIRLLVLGGEACPSALADRLADCCTELWNTYGPTEATVVSCAARLSADEPVRIGLPLDGWQLAVLDPDTGEPLPWGEVGELVIGGVGLARYLDAEKDAAKFPPLPALGWDRAYRSGDLVQADPEGLVYMGRADTQVKIRGYRIELSEIESALMQMPGIAQAVVTTYEPLPGIVELVGYYSLGPDTADLDRRRIHRQLRRRLPAHMVPAYLEQLAVIPMLRTGKADRRNLPEPTGRLQFDTQQTYVEPATGIESALARALSDVLGIEHVSVESHLFDDLGANSLLVAQFCARVRKDAGASPVSTKDVYLHPTIRSLAAAVALEHPVDAESAAVPAGVPAGARASTGQFVLTGALQLLFFLASIYAAALVLSTGFNWISAGTGVLDVYLRSAIFDSVAVVGLCLTPILVKWTLMGRWKSREIPVWSLAYLRFWLVKTIMRASPLALFTGSPLYVLYLRALGAKIGRRVVIFSRTMPVCTDLLTIGDDTVILKESSFTGYRACAGVIQTGSVTVGKDAFIGEHTVIDMGASMGDGTQLGHASALYAPQTIPDGEHWHGSPAQRTDVDYRQMEPARCSPLRRATHGTLQLLGLLFVTAPLVTSAVVWAATRFPAIAALAQDQGRDLTTWDFYRTGLLVSLVLFFGAVVLGFAVVTTVARVLNLLITPGRTYPLYGLHYALHRTIRRLTNTKFYLELMGDSSYVLRYLLALGYRLPDREQTGSNFGAAMEHETPFQVSIGQGTTVADGASFIDAGYSNTSFRVTPVTIGARSFYGNAIAYPSGGRIGDNCLVATRAMIPLDGPVREGVGLLGSPCFEIPRSVDRDGEFDRLKTGDEFRRRLKAKNRHNLLTMGVFLAVRWVFFCLVTLLAMVAWELYAGYGALVIAGLTVATLLFGIAYFTTIERITVIRPLRPQFCWIYDSRFWRHERYWKLLTPYTGMFNGTPFKNLVWRLVGVRLGRRVFDDGCSIPERTLVAIGDDCTLNAGSTIQCHSMEDGTFKSDHTVVEAGCTIGVGALVHYGVTMGEGAQLAPHSFLMKGETVPAHTQWGGNPASQR